LSHPLIDDNGDGRGRDAGQPGADGLTATRLILGAWLDEAESITDPVLLPCCQAAGVAADRGRDLKAGKNEMTPEAYLRELEGVLVDLARVSRQI